MSFQIPHFFPLWWSIQSLLMFFIQLVIHFDSFHEDYADCFAGLSEIIHQCYFITSIWCQTHTYRNSCTFWKVLALLLYLNLTAHNWQKWKRVSWHVPLIKLKGMKQLVWKVANILEKLRYLWKYEIWGNIVKNWYFVNNCLIEARI